MHNLFVLFKEWNIYEFRWAKIIAIVELIELRSILITTKVALSTGMIGSNSPIDFSPNKITTHQKAVRIHMIDMG